jgi:transcriptional regulator with XRE-family HTH domain
MKMQNKLRLYRTNAGLSQFELAEASGVHRCHIQLAETGLRTPTMDQQSKIADCLAVKIEDLFGPSRRENEK